MYRKSIFRIVFAIVFLALFMGYAAQQQAQAAVNAVDLNPKIASGQFVQKVNTFIVIFDATESMNDFYKSNTKLNQEKALVSLLDDTIPKMKLTAAVRVLGEFTGVGLSISKNIFWSMNYSKPDLTKIVMPLKTQKEMIFSLRGSGFSPLNTALDGATADLRSQPGRLAVIAFSDGEDMDKDAPVVAAKRMKSAYGDRICIYTVHIGDNAGGKKLMQQVADEGQCGFMVTGDSISSADGMADFVEKVFLGPKPPEPVKVAAPAPAPPPPPQQEMREMKQSAEAASELEQKLVEKGRAKLLVEFDFNKAVVKPKYLKEIEKLTDVMKKYPDMQIVVEGHTDNVGSKQYNEKLSQKRAEAIKETMAKQFKIGSTRIKAIGYGFAKPVASNKTKEGRQQNRRVEAAVEYMIKKSEPVAAPQAVAPVKQAPPAAEPVKQAEPAVAAPPAAEPVKQAEPVAPAPAVEPVKQAVPAAAAPPAAEPVKKAVPTSDITSDGFMKADKDGFIKSK
jgi:OOP family OmpA-OmpF porin